MRNIPRKEAVLLLKRKRYKTILLYNLNQKKATNKANIKIRFNIIGAAAAAANLLLNLKYLQKKMKYLQKKEGDIILVNSIAKLNFSEFENLELLSKLKKA